MCLYVPHSSAISAFGLFGQESPHPAAYNNKPILVTVSERVCMWVCVHVQDGNKRASVGELGENVKLDINKVYDIRH